MQHQVVLVELKHIRNEYELVLARLRLVKTNPDPLIANGKSYISSVTFLNFWPVDWRYFSWYWSHVGPAYTPEETVLLLCNTGLFDVAIRICKTFKLSLESVFEALTTR